MKKLLQYSPKNNFYDEYIVLDRIVRFSKSEDGETTYIHLENGEIIESEDSLKTLSARIESE